ncbi:MAG: helix-turn-helix transcriptional regulator [Bacteroidetes bacterium]|nr:helix-turn-helix transcriptional regulator [Bacteroidota bacterium]
MKTQPDFDVLTSRLADASGALGELKAASDALENLTRELRDNQRLLEQILTHIPALVMMIDPANRSLKWANPQMESLLGWTAEEAIERGGAFFDAVLESEEQNRIADAANALADENQHVFQQICRMTNRFGDTLRFNSRFSVFERHANGMPKLLLCVALDITQQTETENELKALLRNMSSPEDDARVRSITRRELEVLQLIAQQYSTKQIADALHISIPTVETHRRNLLRKINVKNTAGLIRFAVEQRLIG